MTELTYHFPLHCYIVLVTNRELLKNAILWSRKYIISDSILQFDNDKVKDFVQINAIQVYASIQNFGSAALNLTCSNYILYDPACETVKRKAVN